MPVSSQILTKAGVYTYNGWVTLPQITVSEKAFLWERLSWKDVGFAE